MHQRQEEGDRRQRGDGGLEDPQRPVLIAPERDRVVEHVQHDARVQRAGALVHQAQHEAENGQRYQVDCRGREAVDKPEEGDVVGPITDDKVGGSVFAGNCPLWTYILAEAANYREKETIPVKETDKTIQTPKLGPVGGRIVAEVFLGLMFGDANSMLRLDPGWHPAAGANYRLKDFVNFALGK